MCGIVGCVGSTPKLSEETFILMRDLLAHRGPDDAGSWESNGGAIRLGNRRLAILDLSPAAHQPMVSERNGLVITHNGEVYNYLELRKELEAHGHRFRSTSDTEVILASYQEWGDECLSRLNGMFAFAIWDSKRERLFAARDRFGEKPFYYVIGPDYLLFASEVKALLASGLVPPEPNHRTIYRYLTVREVDTGAETLFQGVRALPPAHALIYSRPDGGLRTWQYWDIDPDERVTFDSDKDYAERFLELLTDSVRIRLRSDVPVGSSLSGGLDSSSVVCLVADETGRGAQETFSARFRDPRYDEGRYIEQVVEQTQAEGHVVYPDPASLSREMERLTWHQEEPFLSTSIYAQWCVMRLAKEEGVTVLLDGQGGDETLAGYHVYFGPYYVDLLKQLRVASLARSGWRYLHEQGPRNLPLILFTMLPPRLRQPVRRHVRPVAVPEAYERTWKGTDERAPLKLKGTLDRAQYETLTRTMLPALLRYADRNAAAFSREIRLPFLDHRLVEFLFSIPSDQRLRGTTTKYILRESMRGLIPEEVRTRKDKLGFAPPQTTWMRGPLRPWIDEVLHSPRFAKREWLDARVTQRVWSEFLGGRDAWQSLLWSWVSLEVWAEVFAVDK